MITSNRSVFLKLKTKSKSKWYKTNKISSFHTSMRIWPHNHSQSQWYKNELEIGTRISRMFNSIWITFVFILLINWFSNYIYLFVVSLLIFIFLCPILSVCVSVPPMLVFVFASNVCIGDLRDSKSKKKKSLTYRLMPSYKEAVFDCACNCQTVKTHCKIQRIS